MRDCGFPGTHSAGIGEDADERTPRSLRTRRTTANLSHPLVSPSAAAGVAQQQSFYILLKAREVSAANTSRTPEAKKGRIPWEKASGGKKNRGAKRLLALQ